MPRIYVCASMDEQFWSHVKNDCANGCWEWQSCLMSSGYGRITINGKPKSAHRVSYALHHPLTINLLDEPMICVCHKCDNPKCCNPAHLFLGSSADNTRDRNEKGRQAKGMQTGTAKMTEQQVLEIRSKYNKKSKITLLKIANEYDVSKSLISKIIHRRTWKHL